MLLTLVLCLGFVSSIPAGAQTTDFWRPLLHVEALLDTLPTTPLHFSSWARNGGNNDMGQYYGSLPNNWKLLAEADGPGIVTGLWFTQYGFTDSMRIRIFVDDTVTARIDTPISRLIGRTAPFLAPLADTTECALHSYVPIPFQSRIRILYSGISIYYHVDMERYSAGTVIPSFTWPPSADYLVRLDSLRERFQNPARPAWASLPVESAAGSAVLAPGARQDLVSYSGARGCRRLLLRLSNHSQAALDNIALRVYTDGRILPDLEGPISALFGAMQGWRSYQSFLTGVSGDSLYLNLPTRFERGLRIEAINNSTLSVACTAIAELVTLTPGSAGPLQLHAVSREENPTVAGVGFEIADVRGRGHFVGMTLDMRATDMHILEGDETMTLDAATTPFWRGTGTEDYFKGGYYWCTGLRALALPNHGCTRYQAGSGVAAYRAHVLDPVPIQSRFRMGIEVGPYNELTAYYRSTAYFYVLPDRWQVDDGNHDGTSFPGETLLVAGYGFVPGTTLNEARLGVVSLTASPPQPTANADGSLEFSVTTPLAAGDGQLPLTAVLTTGPEVIDPAWGYYSCPDLSYHPVRTDADSFAFALDTLEIVLRGLGPWTTATIDAETIPLPWLTPSPMADSLGTLRGRVRLPLNLPVGDYALRAVSSGMLESTSRQRLKMRRFYRLELETRVGTMSPGVSYTSRFAPDYAPSGVHDPWGCNVVHLVTATNPGTGRYFQVTFTLPLAGRYRLNYFFGRCAGGATVRTLVDAETDIDSYDSYTYDAWSWQWLRSDTLHGESHALNAGPHTLRFEILGRNKAATNWLMILDQVVFETLSGPEPVVPVPVQNLVISQIPEGVELRWSPCQSDTSGYPLEEVEYVIFRVFGAAEPVIRAALDDPDSVYVDSIDDVPPGELVSYFVLARAPDRHLPANDSAFESMKPLWKFE